MHLQLHTAGSADDGVLDLKYFFPAGNFMSVLKKEDIARPVRRAETVAVPELGGEVIVRQMTLPLYREMLHYSLNHDGEVPVGRVLADCVVDADQVPVFDEAEWDVWSTAHFTVVVTLYEKIERLSGLRDLEATAKN